MTSPVPKVSGWSQAGSILGLIGGVIAKTSKDKKTQSFGKALAAAGSIPGAIHNPGLTDQEGIGKEIVKQLSPNAWDISWQDNPTDTNFGSLFGVTGKSFDLIKPSYLQKDITPIPNMFDIPKQQ